MITWILLGGALSGQSSGQRLVAVGHFIPVVEPGALEREAAALIARLDVLVTPDTGPLHVAAALKTPTIGLFAVASPVNSNPDFDENIHKFIKKPRTCSPCVGKNCKFQECMLQIGADEVWEMLKEMI